MNEQIQELMKQAGTDVSGKWMSTDNAEKFAMLVIAAYNKELDESRREIGLYRMAFTFKNLIDDRLCDQRDGAPNRRKTNYD